MLFIKYMDDLSMYFLLGEKVMNVVNSIPLEEIKDKVDVYEYIKKKISLSV